ncbi:MAG: hypothetical protein DMF63_17310 [Acidobacteria bacterium]|nr:MAG: hypothetical protein DMF63_17310 [Acidobacteriota bacterium]
MKNFKRILLVLLVLLVLAQIPFIYRRYETGKLAEKIAQLDAQRTTNQDPTFKEYKGIIHAHTNLGGHSTGSFDELIAAANSNDLDFVLMTEHYSDTFDTAEKTLNGVYGKTLFVGGNEIDTSDGDRFLLIPGGGEAARVRMSGTTAFLNAAHASNQLALITYPEKFKSWDSQFDGIEVFSLHTIAKQMNPLTALGDLIWTYPSYPELMLAKNFQRPDANLAKFDEIAASRPISLFAGTDAHSNIGFHIFGDDAGNKPLGIKLDPYETIFRIARIHVLIEKDKEFNRESLIEAIRAGNFFVGFDAIGDTTGFVFRIEDIEVRTSADDHSPVPKRGELTGRNLEAIAPAPARFVVYKNGDVIAEVKATPIATGISAMDPGVYRVEVYRDDLGPPFDKIPWIISNPIYVR